MTLSATDLELAPYRLELPAQLSFSGGRTSGLLLHNVIRAFGGKLPEEVRVTFFNTGKEREETLEFVHEVEQRWDVPIVWLEYDRVQDDVGEWRNTYRIVDFHSASRNGEPFETLIRARSYLPNVVTRFCTTELKIKVGKKYLLDQGWEHWTAAIGIRADEPDRFNGKYDPRWTRVLPLVDAGVVLEDVHAFWRQQRGGVDLRQWLSLPRDSRTGWDLALEPDEGNCDLCFLKGRKKLVQLIQRRPSAAGWWIDQERLVGGISGGHALAQFSSRRTYGQLREHALGGPLFCDITDPDDEVLDCHCTD